MKFNVSSTTSLMALAAVSIALLFSIAARAQDDSFQVGESVEVKVSSTYGWEPCVVTENPPRGVMRVRCKQRDGRPAGVFVVYDKRDVRKVNGRPARGKDTAAEPDPKVKAPGDGSTKGELKVGSLVEASPTFSTSKWRPCRISEISTGGGLKVWCEDHDGQPSGTYSVTSRWVRPRTYATAGDKGGEDCQYEPPAGKVTSTSRPSEQLFKLVLYNHFNEETIRAIPRPSKVGITFESFKLGDAYSNGFIGRRLKHDGAPQNAMIYPVKTRFVWCRLYQSSVYRYVMEASYICFKDKQGNWDCPVDGVPKTIDQKDFPVSGK